MVCLSVYKPVDLLNSFGLTLVTWSGSLPLVKLLIFVVFYFLQKKVSMLANVSALDCCTPVHCTFLFTCLHGHSEVKKTKKKVDRHVCTLISLTS